MIARGIAVSSANLQSHCNIAQLPIFSKTHLFNGHSSSNSVVKFLHRRSVSASSLSGSAGTFPEHISDEEVKPQKTSKKKKKKQIAGIDQDELLDPELLADPDSCFCEFRGVKIHHKIYESQSSEEEGNGISPGSSKKKLGFPIILLHGFGASVFSWSRATKRLAEATSAPKVVAFDRPAFGLTSRIDPSSLKAEDSNSKPLNPYSMAFAVLATLYFVDFLKAEKSVLVGHSAGCLVAVDTYFEAPDRVAALILVAPAIFAPNPSQNVSGRDDLAEGDEQESGGFLGMLGKPFVALLKILSRIAAAVARTTLKLLNGMKNMLSSLYKKALSAILCSALGVMLIRMAINRFGVVAVKNAWYDQSQVSEEIVNGYTKPLRVKGWDKALAEFTAATIAVVESELRPPGSKRLHEISCPVLIVTGDTDRIVPAWNAKRLSQAIPGSSLEVIKDCGHLPHEEKVEEFVSIVQKFLQRAFSDMKEPSVQMQPS
ncbi:2-hydroxy-6-oxononadienedioate/2-hydroxy-6-oxononatrienedioate hydrolase 2 [Linum perenne]